MTNTMTRCKLLVARMLAYHPIRTGSCTQGTHPTLSTRMRVCNTNGKPSVYTTHAHSQYQQEHDRNVLPSTAVTIYRTYYAGAKHTPKRKASFVVSRLGRGRETRLPRLPHTKEAPNKTLWYFYLLLREVIMNVP